MLYFIAFYALKIGKLIFLKESNLLNHRISTENNRTPEQLFWCNIRLAEHYEGVLPEHINQPNVEELVASDLLHAYVPDTVHLEKIVYRKLMI